MYKWRHSCILTINGKRKSLFQFVNPDIYKNVEVSRHLNVRFSGIILSFPLSVLYPVLTEVSEWRIVLINRLTGCSIFRGIQKIWKKIPLALQREAPARWLGFSFNNQGVNYSHEIRTMIIGLTDFLYVFQGYTRCIEFSYCRYWIRS